ncbi:hypothetical protein ACHAW5_004222 [Stephanodiscus triporus]|uniref:Uncharacterized protein n=1 Tax=Stephanodiscus triporus TaxID=2934178 RepID=A0ABD3NPH0_9STRA
MAEDDFTLHLFPLFDQQNASIKTTSDVIATTTNTISFDGGDSTTLDVKTEVSKPKEAHGGKYRDDYERLLELTPHSGQAETIAGEIMRAVTKMNQNFSTLETLHNCWDAINFLAMAGIFDESGDACKALATLLPYAKQYGNTFHFDEVRKATEQISDSSIAFILQHPDLEYAENTTDMSLLYSTCRINFIEQLLLRDQRIFSTEKEKVMLGEIATPKIANKSSDSRMSIKRRGTTPGE